MLTQIKSPIWWPFPDVIVSFWHYQVDRMQKDIARGITDVWHKTIIKAQENINESSD